MPVLKKVEKIQRSSLLAEGTEKLLHIFSLQKAAKQDGCR